MNKREALKLKPGDLVIAPKVGLRVPVKIVSIVGEEVQGNHPLFIIDDQRGDPITFKLLENAEVQA